MKLNRLKNSPNLPLHFFDWKFDFPEVMNPVLKEKGGIPTSTGFDIVIGNPPYGAKFSDLEKNVFRIKYPETQFKIDSYSLFLLKSLQLFKKLGISSYIIPNTLLDNYFEEKVREKLLTENKITSIIDLHDNIFNAAVVHSMIFSFQNIHEEDYEISVGTSNNIYEPLTKIPSSFFKKQDKFLFSIRNYHSKDLLDKLSINTIALGKILDIRQTIKTGDDKKYLRLERNGKNYKPILRGKDIFKWTIIDPKIFVDYGKHLACPRDYRIFEQPKIVIREAGNRITSTYDGSGFYIMSSLYNCILIDKNFDLKYLLALLNSKVFQYQMNLLTFEKTKGAFTKARIFHYYNLPVKQISSPEILIDLVDKILELKTYNPDADINALEEQLDLYIYKIYELSYEEVKIIDSNFVKDEKEYNSVSLHQLQNT